MAYYFYDRYASLVGRLHVSAGAGLKAWVRRDEIRRLESCGLEKSMPLDIVGD